MRPRYYGSCRAVVRRTGAVVGGGSAARVGTPVVAPVPLRDVRPPRAALRPATGAAVAACAVGTDDGVAAVSPWRVSCRHCGVRVEQVSWAASGSAFTASCEELVAYLSQTMDRTAVSRLMAISWQAVGSIVERVVARQLDPARFHGLKRIGVDEFSYRKRHHYLTVVVDHDRRRVVWAGKGRSAETLEAFFDLLGPAGCERIELVTADLASSWQKALRARVPHARVVFDRFHVERLAADALDEVRRAEQHRSRPSSSRGCAIRCEAPGAAEAGRGAAAGGPAPAPRARTGLRVEGMPGRHPGRGHARRWPGVAGRVAAWASRSRLAPFVKLAKTVRKHAAGILAYLDTKMTNGIVEGINNKLRVIARRAYGFHSHGALISMLFLCCGGIQLAPPLPTRV